MHETGKSHIRTYPKEYKNSFIIHLCIHKKVILFHSGKMVLFHSSECLNKGKKGEAKTFSPAKETIKEIQRAPPQCCTLLL